MKKLRTFSVNPIPICFQYAVVACITNKMVTHIFNGSTYLRSTKSSFMQVWGCTIYEVVHVQKPQGLFFHSIRDIDHQTESQEHVIEFKVDSSGFGARTHPWLSTCPPSARRSC